MTALMSVDDLCVEFDVEGGVVRALNGVSYAIAAGETLGVVGESGSGKSVTLLAALGLLPSTARITGGRVVFEDEAVTQVTERRLSQLRGGSIGMIFQDPMTAFNPVLTIGSQIAESVRRHQPGSTRRSSFRRAIELLDEVGIPQPQIRAKQYPHEYSGGMRQRAMIAMAISNRPKLIIADEPTTALDVTIQAQILDLIKNLQRETGAALIIVTHDLGVVAEVADRVVVMYGGRVVESTTVDRVFHSPRHPYTDGLLKSLPRLEERSSYLHAIPGYPPNPLNLPAGCVFMPRCPLSGGREECKRVPSLVEVEADHLTACHFSEEVSTSGVEL